MPLRSANGKNESVTQQRTIEVKRPPNSTHVNTTLGSTVQESVLWISFPFISVSSRVAKLGLEL